MKNNVTCRCVACGHPLPDARDYEFSPSEDIVFAAIKRAGIRGVMRRNIEALLYSDDEPEKHQSNVPTFVRRINKRLKPQGLVIRCSRGRNGGRYQLVELNSAQHDCIQPQPSEWAETWATQ